MSNYTITTDFGAKDSLPSSNDSKVVRGSEFTTEFTSIQTAIATKADTAGDTFTGVVNFSADVAVNTNTLFVDVSEAKVGIGTASPDTLLHVHGAGSGSGTYGAQITIGKSNGCKISSTQESADDDVQGLAFFTKASNQLSDSAVERLRIDSSGNVLIGGTQKQSPSGIDKGMFIQSQTNGDVVGVNLYANEASNNRRADFFLDDANGVYGMHTTASTGLADFVIRSSSDERFRVTSTGNVGIGEINPADKLQVTDGAFRIKSTYPRIYLEDSDNNSDYSIINNNGDFRIYDDTEAAYRMVIDSTGNVGIGTTSPSTNLQVENNSNATTTTAVQNTTAGASARANFRAISDNSQLDIYATSSSYTGVASWQDAGIISTAANTSGGLILNSQAHDIKFQTATTERMRIDSSGNVLVGVTSLTGADGPRDTSTTAGLGVGLNYYGGVYVAAYQASPFVSNRISTDGELFTFKKNGTTVGNIGVDNSDNLVIEGNSTHSGLQFGTSAVLPHKNGSAIDATVDIGHADNRFKDLYRSGSTYSTSDRNKKQDIRDLTDAEARVATVAKGSLKAFRYIDSVEAEGDEANIHFGIIAQDLKAAFEAEGLNANDYQVFKTSTYTDDDGVEQTTYSICYENLLAFIIAAI